MIGAGSVVFSKNLTGDILSFPEFKSATFSYMDIDADRLQVGAALCRKVAKGLGANPTIEATTDRRKALDGADFVINMVQIGGFDSTLVDFEIPRKYGLNFTIADTTGPGGFFRALRTFPMLKGLCADMMQLCPRALLLNYSNPMSMNMQTISRTSNIAAVGLCHSVQGTFNQLMGYIGEDPDKVAFICAGINHMAFYLKIEREGVDLYPRLFEAMNRKEVFDSNRVRFEMMRRLGHFVTESSEHNAEYNPWFIPHGKDYVNKFDVPIDEYLRRCDGIVGEFERMKQRAQSDDAMEHRRSHEYGSSIIHSVVTGTPRVVYGNMPNRGAISSLPNDAIAEAPTLVDRNGCQFTTVGALPPQLTAYMLPHVAQHELFIRAALEGRRDHVYQAALFDPLTAATMPPDKIVEMCDELIAAHGDERDGGVLPALDSKKALVPTSGRQFGRVDPKNLRDSWDAAQKQADDDAIAEWHILGPFPAADLPISVKQKTAIDEERASKKDGALDLAASHTILSNTLVWKRVSAGRRGFVDCNQHFGPQENCLCYGYAEVQSVHAREARLQIGSDDGIAVWVNGKLVHELDAQRPYRAGDDTIAVQLQAGVNRIIAKVTQHIGGWGFGVGVSRANF
jgi:alpha-galactosidase